MKTTIHALWKEVYPDKKAYVDSYFHTYFNNDQNRSLVIDGDIQASVQVHQKRLNLHGKQLRTSFLVGCIGSLGDRKQLVENVLEEVSQSDLLTLIQTDSPEDYESLGFETVVETKIYNFSSSHIPDFPMDGIVLEPSLTDVQSVYKKFTSHFTGFFDRSLEDFELIKKNLKDQKGSIVGYVEEGILVGYASYINHGSSVEILECAYDKSGTLLRLLSFVSRGVSRIVFHASESERINKVLPDLKAKKVTFMMARVNDHELFERLYHIKIISAYSAFNAFGLPVFNRDFF